MPSVVQREVFTPTLLNSPAVEVTLEQKEYIYNILSLSCSDSKFTDKAYQAIVRVLTGGSATPPVVGSLNPSSAALGSPSFTLQVSGTGFTPTSEILWNGSPESTVFVSPTELTTGVDMSTAQVAMDIPVAVLSGGVLSDSVVFSLTDPAARSVVKEKESHPVLGTKEVKK